MISDILNQLWNDDEPCKHCGVDISKHTNKCEHCGQSQDKFPSGLKKAFEALTDGMYEPDVETETANCRFCGQSVSADFTHCPHCNGYRPLGHSLTRQRLIHTTKPCQNCTAEIPINAHYCQYCESHQIGRTPGQPPSYTPANPQQGTPLRMYPFKLCSNCRRKISRAALICQYCESTQHEARPVQDNTPHIIIHDNDLLERIHIVSSPIDLPRYNLHPLPQRRTPDNEERLIANAFNLVLTSEEQDRLNLINKGYSHEKIAKFYQVEVGRVAQWEDELCQRFLVKDKEVMLQLARQAGLVKT